MSCGGLDRCSKDSLLAHVRSETTDEWMDGSCQQDATSSIEMSISGISWSSRLPFEESLCAGRRTVAVLCVGGEEPVRFRAGELDKGGASVLWRQCHVS